MIRIQYFHFYIILISFFSAPYILLEAYTKEYRIVNTLLILSSFVFLALYKNLLNKIDLAWMSTWITCFSYMFIQGLIMEDKAQIINSLGYALKIGFLFIFMIFMKNNYHKSLNIFFKLNIFFMLLSVCLFFLLAIGIDLPVLKIFSPSAGINDIEYLYPLGIVKTRLIADEITIIRINGITDEPGQLALLITILLILNEFSVKSRAYRYILSFCGIFTFSLAFMISFTLFVSYYLLFVSKNKINLILMAGMLIVTSFAIYLMLNDNLQNILDSLVLNRFAPSDDSSLLIKGDNRTHSIIKSLEQMYEEERLLFGYGASVAYEKGLLQHFAAYGLLSIIFLYVPVYYLIIKSHNSTKVLLLFLIVLNFLQRPGLFSIFLLISLTLIFYSIRYNTSKHYIRVRPCI